MKRLPRLFAAFPECERELFALPRWWLSLFGLLSTATFTCVIVLADPGKTGVANAFELLYMFLIGSASLFALITGILVGRRAGTESACDVRRSAYVTLHTVFELLLAAMVHVYTYLLASMPFFVVILVLAWDSELTWTALRALLHIEGLCLWIAGVGLLLGALSQRRTPVPLALGLLVLFVLIMSAVELRDYNDMTAGFAPLAPHELADEAPFLPYVNGDTIDLELWLQGLGQQLLFLWLTLCLLVAALRTPRGWSGPRRTILGITALIAFIAGTMLWGGRRETATYLVLVGSLLLTLPFLIVPGYEQLHERGIRMEHGSRWQRFWNPSGGPFLPLIACMSIAALPPALAALAGVRLAPPLTAWQGFVATVLVLLLMTAWTCFVASLVEHCDLYVRRKGRLLALLVAMLFLVAPPLLTSPIDMQGVGPWVTPFAWLDPVDCSRHALPFLCQIICVSLNALGIHLWTDFQRRQAMLAQRRRIEEALAIKGRSS